MTIFYSVGSKYPVCSAKFMTFVKPEESSHWDKCNYMFFIPKITSYLGLCFVTAFIKFLLMTHVLKDGDAISFRLTVKWIICIKCQRSSWERNVNKFIIPLVKHKNDPGKESIQSKGRGKHKFWKCWQFVLTQFAGRFPSLSLWAPSEWHQKCLIHNSVYASNHFRGDL